MQETRNNSFGSKIRNTSGENRIAWVPKYSSNCCSAFVLTCFRLTKDRATYFRPKTIVASFLHLMVLFFKVFFKYLWKESNDIRKKRINNNNKKYKLDLRELFTTVGTSPHYITLANVLSFTVNPKHALMCSISEKAVKKEKEN